LNGAAWSFLLLACVSAALAGRLIQNGIVSMVVVVACIAILDLVSRAGVPADAKVLMALLTGGGVSAFALTPLLFLRPRSSKKTRLTVAVGATFLAHAAYLAIAIAYR
jgi:hypothetical protein